VVRIAQRWLERRLGLLPEVRIRVTVTEDEENYGCCWRGEGPHEYEISLHPLDDIRDLVATLAHEMVHVWQWERGFWEGDGEAEAHAYEYVLADELLGGAGVHALGSGDG
jgi:hypothetical protein